MYWFTVLFSILWLCALQHTWHDNRVIVNGKKMKCNSSTVSIILRFTCLIVFCCRITNHSFWSCLWFLFGSMKISMRRYNNNINLYFFHEIIIFTDFRQSNDNLLQHFPTYNITIARLWIFFLDFNYLLLRRFLLNFVYGHENNNIELTLFNGLFA